MKKPILISLILLLLSGLAQAGTQVFWIKGYKYYPLYAVCQSKDIEYSWDSIGRVATLRKNGVEAKIMANSDMMLINGERLKDIGPPAFFCEEMVVIPATFAESGIDRIFKYSPKSKVYTKKYKRTSHAPTYIIDTIVLDPGHGGSDPGAIGRYCKLKEKDINLDIAKRLKKLLLSNGIKVYLTRDRDASVTLWKRAEFANNKRADFFISIHTNASRSKELKGFEVYYLSEATDDNARAREAADNTYLDVGNGSMDRYNSNTKAIVYDLKFSENRVVSKKLSGHLLKAARGKNIYVRRNSLRSARFHILKDISTDMPAILVEIGYISNKKEEGQLGSTSYRQKIAEALAKGILAYKDEYEKRNGFCR